MVLNNQILKYSGVIVSIIGILLLLLHAPMLGAILIDEGILGVKPNFGMYLDSVIPMLLLYFIYGIIIAAYSFSGFKKVDVLKIIFWIIHASMYLYWLVQGSAYKSNDLKIWFSVMVVLSIWMLFLHKKSGVESKGSCQ